MSKFDIQLFSFDNQERARIAYPGSKFTVHLKVSGITSFTLVCRKDKSLDLLYLRLGAYPVFTRDLDLKLERRFFYKVRL